MKPPSILVPTSLVGGVAVFSWLVTWLGALVISSSVKRAGQAHWTERARSAFPLWSFNGFTPVGLAFVFLVATPVILQIEDAPEANGVAGMVAVVAFLTSLLAGTGAEGRVRDRAISLADTGKSWAVMVLMFVPNLAVCAAMLIFLPPQLDAYAIIVISIAASVILLLRYGGSLFLLRLLGLLHEAPPSLRETVKQPATAAGVRCRCVVVEWKSANAIAFSSTNTIAFTTPMLEIMDERELATIAAHEVAHLCEPRSVQFARFVGSFLLLPVFAAGPVIGSFGFSSFLIMSAFVGLSYMAMQKIARAMEVRADAAGRAYQTDEGSYARALEKLYAYNLVPAVLRQQRAVHPHLYDRLISAGVIPDYPRPAPPSRWPVLIANVIIVIAAFMFVGFWGAMVRLLSRI